MPEESNHPDQRIKEQLGLRSEVNHDELVAKFKGSLGTIQNTMNDGYYYHPTGDERERRQFTKRKLGTTTFSAEPGQDHTIQVLEKLLKHELGEETAVIQLGYDANRSNEKSEQGTVLVELLPGEQSQVQMFIGGVPMQLKK